MKIKLLKRIRKRYDIRYICSTMTYDKYKVFDKKEKTFKSYRSASILNFLSDLSTSSNDNILKPLPKLTYQKMTNIKRDYMGGLKL